MAVVNEAGAIVVRAVANEWKVLLITAKNVPTHWIFPKGHVEAGESSEQAAVREVFEEAGVHARPIAPAGSLSFMLHGDTIHVQYILAITEDPGAPEPGRRLAWCSYRDALSQLTFQDTRRVLTDAWRHVPAA